MLEVKEKELEVAKKKEEERRTIVNHHIFSISMEVTLAGVIVSQLEMKFYVAWSCNQVRVIMRKLFVLSRVCSIVANL